MDDQSIGFGYEVNATVTNQNARSVVPQSDNRFDQLPHRFIRAHTFHPKMRCEILLQPTSRLLAR